LTLDFRFILSLILAHLIFLLEQVDVYSFGNIIYSLLQEEVPFADEKAKDVPDLVMDGVRPSIYYDVWNSTDPIVQALKEAMIMCHEHEPEERATAREVEVYLKSKLDEFDPGRLREWGDA
jgi:serine/threonine protein kinase